MLHPPARPRRAALSVALAVVATTLAACGSPQAGPPTGPGTTSAVTLPTSGSSSTATTSTATSTASRTATTSTGPTGSSTSPTSSAPPATTPSRSCAATIVAGLTPDERAGQLLMVGLDVNAGRSSLDALVGGRHLGGVILLGGWYDGADAVRATTAHLAGLASATATGGLGLFLAVDQEGGNVQQLRGAGFTRMPSALQQGAMSPAALTRSATGWGKEVKAAGLNVNLAPVADTVPTSIGRANQPIGRWGREYAHDPDRVATMSVAFLEGMHAAGVAATVKHFPGLGRITGNTDVTATGITDSTTTTTDPYLRPFAAGIRAGADFVMVGSAIYSKIDPGTNAVFSRAVVTDLLRDRMGYDGVVITDDVGAAKAVAAVPVGERATRFIAAGGDIVLTARPATVATMHDAITGRMASDPAFAAQVEAAVTRVVTLKVDRGLARC